MSSHFLVVKLAYLCHDRRPHIGRFPSLLPGGLMMIRHFGVLIPSTNTTVEMEYNRLLPPTLQVHVGRLGKGDNTPFSSSRPDDIAYQARLLGTAQVEIVCLAQTSASLSADEYDATTTRQMTASAGVPSLTSAHAIGQAVRALGASRIALVSPYSQDVLGRVAYPLAADNVLRPLPYPLIGGNQLVMRTRNRFARPRPALLACNGTHLGRSTLRGSTPAGS